MNKSKKAQKQRKAAARKQLGKNISECKGHHAMQAVFRRLKLTPKECRDFLKVIGI